MYYKAASEACSINRPYQGPHVSTDFKYRHFLFLLKLKLNSRNLYLHYQVFRDQPEAKIHLFHIIGEKTTCSPAQQRQITQHKFPVLKPLLLITNTAFPIRRKDTFLFLLVLTVHKRCSPCCYFYFNPEKLKQRVTAASCCSGEKQWTKTTLHNYSGILGQSQSSPSPSCP